VAAPRDEDRLVHLSRRRRHPTAAAARSSHRSHAGDVAPTGRAVFDLGHDAGLQAGVDGTARIGAIRRAGARSSLLFMVITAVRRPDSSE